MIKDLYKDKLPLSCLSFKSFSFWENFYCFVICEIK